MIRLTGFLFMLAVTAGGGLYFDFKTVSRAAGSDGDKRPTFTEYLGDLPGRLSTLASSISASGLRTKLADMLPKPPEGWKVRPAVAEDVAPFLPKNVKKAPKDAIKYLKDLAVAEAGSGAEVTVLAYEKGERVVLIKAIRYPNSIFTGDTSSEQRFTLQTRAAAYRGSEFMRVRGLDVTEDLLPEGFRGRYFLADVGGQIHLSLLAPKRMSDKELLPFFETLDVKAMNDSVVDRTEGLGEVPVIVLASALEDTAREAFYADATARREQRAATYEAERREAKATAIKATVPDDTGGGFLDSLFGGDEATTEVEEKPETEAAKIVCKTDKDGVKRCAAVSDSGG